MSTIAAVAVLAGTASAGSVAIAVSLIGLAIGLVGDKTVDKILLYPEAPATGEPKPPNGPSAEGAAAAAAGTAPPRIDPLVLDLDGDGIETTGIAQTILFDHNADGVKTGTGWVKPDDGWLVLDRNGNGTIDSGRELFGVDTIKKNGQFAIDGFDALKDQDTNNDGKINSLDSVFANLKIWRDLNQDGINYEKAA